LTDVKVLRAIRYGGQDSNLNRSFMTFMPICTKLFLGLYFQATCE